MKQKGLMIMLAMVTALALNGCESTSNLKVVSGFNKQKYMGTWYEIARFPHSFEKDLEAVSATYSLNKDGTINVVNKGYNTEKDYWDTIKGEARFKGARTEGWIQVSFFKPIYASYKIIYLNEDYSQAIVTGSNYSYLWILAREPDLPRDELEMLIEKTEQFGFDLDKLMLVDQSKNLQE